MERKQFTFYESFFSAVFRIKSKASRCDAYDAICKYALYGEEPDVDALADSAAIAFELIRPTLDASRHKAENRLNKAKSSKEQTDNKSKSNKEQSVNKKEKESKKESKKENEKEREEENDSSLPPVVPPLTGEEPKRVRFAPPTVEQVKAYCLERGNSVNAQQFVDFYSSKGWKVGSTPMKDWRAAVRTWEHRDDVEQRHEKPAGAPDRPKPDRAELERMRKAMEAM